MKKTKAKHWIAICVYIIAVLFVSMSTSYAGEWKQEEDLWWYQNDDNTYPCDCWKEINSAWYYFNPWGYVHTGWLFNNEQWYFLQDNGKMFSGWLPYHDNWYYFYPNGAMATGWILDNDDWYFMNTDGSMQTGWIQQNNNWYFLNWNGKMATGLTAIGDAEFFFLPNGIMQTGEVHINDDVYYFDEHNGRRVQNTNNNTDQVLAYSSNTDWLIFVNSTENVLYVYYDTSNGWKLYDCWQVSCGALETPTVTGQFSIGYKGYSFGDGFTCYYYSSFYDDYLFHSTLFYENTFIPLDPRLGMNLSHGCVRMSLEHAKWIYENIPYGTAVIVTA